MTPNHVYSAYKTMQMQSMDKLQILILLYEGAIHFMNQARDFMLAKDYAKKGKFIGKAEDIIIELCNSLDMEKGGEIAVNLSRLYDFALYQLTMANLKNEPRYIDEASKTLSTLLVSWKAIGEKQPETSSVQDPASQNVAPSAAPRPSAVVPPAAAPRTAPANGYPSVPRFAVRA